MLFLCSSLLFLFVFVVVFFLFFLISFDYFVFFFFFSSRRRHTRWTGDWSSDVCSSDLLEPRSERARERSGDGDHGPGGLREIDRADDRPGCGADPADVGGGRHAGRSEERRVGKEGRSRVSPWH